MNALTDKITVRDRLRQVLVNATGERSFRSSFVDTGSGREIEWVLYERMEMLTAVNRIRAERDRPPVTLHEVERADRVATGTDWLDKFSLYCAELAVCVSEVKKQQSHKTCTIPTETE